MLFDRDLLGGDYERLVVVQDAPSGLRAVVAIHSTALGPAFGGIRRLAYADDVKALRDVQRLAAMMSYKCALADLPAGGAKTVVLDHPGLDVEAGYRALGRAIEDLQGQYVCGPDVGTGEEHLDVVRSQTRHVNPKGNDAPGSTAAGVIAGLRGTLEVFDGDARFADRRFVVQGLGAVGMAIAKRLIEEGGHVYGHDVHEGAMRNAAEIGVEPVTGNTLWNTPCDVFVPCALGGILDTEHIRLLQARAVCGSANNQLVDTAAAEAMVQRGILYAPDFVVNAGAVVEGVFTIRDGATTPMRQAARAHIEDIASVTRKILTKADEERRSSHAVALELARAKIAGGDPADF